MTKSVAIVGAGIVGATAAYQLSKKGIAVTVFDARESAKQLRLQRELFVRGYPNAAIKTGTNSYRMGQRIIQF